MAGKGPLSDIAAKTKREGHEGIFARAAKRRGMSTHAYAEKEKHAKGKTGARARLALIYEAHRPH